VALDIRDQDNDIWILDLARAALNRLTFGPATEARPIWTPNGQAVIFSRGQSPFEDAGPRNFFRQAPDPDATPEPLTEGAVTHVPFAVTPGGAELIFGEQKVDKSSVPNIAERAPANLVDRAADLMLLPLMGKRHPQSLLPQTEFREMNAEISPNGHWLAYQSNKSGQEEIYVRAFPIVGTKEWQVSTSGGAKPLWVGNGELFYESKGALMRVSLMMMGSTLKPDTPLKVLERPYFYGADRTYGRTYDVLPDGKRFLMIKEISGVDEPTPSARLIVVQNWTEELKRLVPAR
jgi:Tol biopolymer transport system component